MQDFKELVVWREAMTLVELIYKTTVSYPKDEIYRLTSQTRRAAISIPSNIAEGYGRKNFKEYRRFLLIANGSLKELETHLLIAERVSYITAETLETLQSQLNAVGRLITATNKMVESKLGKK